MMIADLIQQAAGVLNLAVAQFLTAYSLAVVIGVGVADEMQGVPNDYHR